MGLYTLKFWYRKVIEPLAKLNVHPDFLAYLAVFVSLLTAVLYYFADKYPYFLLIAMILILTRMTLNTLDGVIAIKRKLVSLKGEIMNAFPDRYSDIFLFGGIAFSPLCITPLGLIATTLILLVSYSGMLGKAIGVSWQHNGPLGKVDRLLALILFTFLQFIFLVFKINIPQISGISFTVLDIFMIWCILGSQITIFNRISGMMKEIKGKKVV